MTDPIATLSMLNLDSGDPAGLTAFYAKALGWEVTYSDENYGMLTSESGTNIGFGRIENYRPPAWPDTSGVKRYHLDLKVADLQNARDSLVEMGATVADPQPPDATNWIVMLDPQGQPFCLVPTGEDS